MTTPQIFTTTFWQATIAQVVHAAAGGALTAWGIGAVGATDPATHVSVPWWGLFMGAVIGGLTALLLALSSNLVPGTGPATFLPEQTPAKVAARTPRRSRKPRKAPTTADLHKTAEKNPPAGG
jgi:hypothetical protein